MKSFDYTITDPVGIHLRNITPLIRLAREYPGCEVTIVKGGSAASLFRNTAVLKLAVKQGDTVTVRAEGENEAAAADALEAFFRENL